MFEMYVNAAVHTVTLAFLLFLLQKGLHTGTRYTFFFLAALLFAIPYGYENTLAGFQVQFYFLLLFSFLFLWAVTRFGTGSKLWFPVIVFAAFMSFGFPRRFFLYLIYKLDMFTDSSFTI